MNSTNITPPSYDAAMVEGRMPISIAVAPINMESESLPVQIGAPNLAYQHTEVHTTVTVINPAPLQVVTVGNPDGGEASSTPTEEEGKALKYFCCCLEWTWKIIVIVFGCLLATVCYIIACACSMLADDD